LNYTTNLKLSKWEMDLGEIKQRGSNLKEPMRLNFYLISSI